MKIKKFIANSMPEAMRQIKDQLGNDAIILNSKEVKSAGLFGLFGRKQIEVTAMLDDNIPKATKPQKNQSLRPRTTQMSNRSEKGNGNEDRILAEIKHLQSILTKETSQTDSNFPPMLNHVYDYLINQEVDGKIAFHIVQSILNEAKQNDLDRENIHQLLRKNIDQSLSKISYANIDQKSKVLHFVGPTGVGKTTTIAKVAANSMLHNQRSVAFITADTYRIAAIEQLKTYATILDVPIEVVYSPEDYKKALQKFSSYDLIFVDTAGRNYREERYINELKQFILTPDVPTQTFLVLSLTAKHADITDVYEQFKKINIEQVIYTKLDETESYGSLLNLAINEGVGIAYLTNGQNVPDDLLMPDQTTITDLLLRRYSDV